MVFRPARGVADGADGAIVGRMKARALGALAAALAACATTKPSQGPDPAAAAAACGRFGGSACTAVGVSALSGRDGRPDERLAATFLLWACDTGDAAGCARLAALYAEGRGVRLDPSRAAELARRAHVRAPPPRRGRAPADDRAGLDPISPAEVERQLELVDLFVPESFRERLGLTRDRIVAAGLATPEDRGSIEALVAERVGPASECLDRAVGPGIGVGWVAFRLDRDGRPADLRVEVSPAPVPGAEAAAQCLRDRVSAWEFPLPRRTSGGLVWLELVRGPSARAPAVVRAGSPGAPATPPGIAPSLADAGCLRAAVAEVPGPLAADGASLALRFRVGAQGDVSDVHFLTSVPLDTGRALRAAILRCEWRPARAVDGQAVAAWAIVPIPPQAG